jgi:beta-hydroxyacyl-ACP dehydratase FabZ
MNVTLSRYNKSVNNIITCEVACYAINFVMDDNRSDRFDIVRKIVIVCKNMGKTIKDIQNIIPHRYPFLLVDKIISEDDSHIVGIKNVTMNEPFFQGHFPGFPVMPGVLILEAMAQVGAVFMLQHVEEPEKKIVYFASIDHAKFRKPVVPGDQLRLELELLRLRKNSGKMKGVAYVDNEIVAEAELFTIVESRE